MLLVLPLHFGGLFVDGLTILVFHLGSLEYFVAFSLLASVFVVTWLMVDFRLVKIGVEIAWIRSIVHVDVEVVGKDF